VGLLMPSLTGARQRSKVTKCQANVRELAAATLSYLSENGDFFPVAADCSDGICWYWNGHQYLGWNGRIPNPLGRLWARPINKELGLEPAPPSASVAKIAECPGDAGAPGETGSSEKLFDATGTSYPLNPLLCQGRFSIWKYRDKDLNLSHILQPPRKVLVFDHPAFGLCFDGYWTAIRPGWHDTTRPAAVVGFIDGHVEYVTNRGGLREWQWYGEASGPEFVRRLRQKIDWTVIPGCE